MCELMHSVNLQLSFLVTYISIILIVTVFSFFIGICMYLYFVKSTLYFTIFKVLKVTEELSKYDSFQKSKPLCS